MAWAGGSAMAADGDAGGAGTGSAKVRERSEGRVGRGRRMTFHYARRADAQTFPVELRWPAVMLACVIGALFWWTLWRMWERWNNTHGYYSHGPLVLPIAAVTAYLIVRRRGLPMHSTRGS